MLTNGSRYWIGIAAIFAIDLFVTATVQAASPFPIWTCPYNIATAGSYAVTSDLKAIGTCITISIPLDDVAIDLQGHTVTGGGAGYGIVCFSPNAFGFPCNHILITNGTVTGFGTGIFLFGHSNTIINMTVRGSTGSSPGAQGNGHGVVLVGNGTAGVGFPMLNVVKNTTSVGNVGDGIYGGDSLYISNSKANDNGSSGIEVSNSYFSTIINTQANNNGFYGIRMGVGFVTGSTAKSNALYGIYGGVISVDNSAASNNGGDGIVAGLSPGGGGSVTNSDVQHNGGRGIALSCPVSAFGNKAINNKGGNLVTSDNTCLLDHNYAP
jgi:hypothetical protein